MKSIANVKSSSSVGNAFISTPQTQHAMDRIEEVMGDTQRTYISKGLVIQGPSGVGKSTLIQQFIQLRYMDTPVHDQNLKTVYVEIPSMPTNKSLGTAFLIAFGDQFATQRGHSAEIKLERIVGLIKALGTELVILDEAQHIVDHRKSTAYGAADWIKSLMNKTSVTVVLVGLKRTENLLIANEQLRRRFSAVINFDRFKIKGISTWQLPALLDSIESIVPVKTVKFTSPELLPRFYHASYGLMDYLIKIIDRAVWLVNHNNKEGITMQVLHSAFKDEIWSAANEERNPFSPTFNNRALTGPREPFENFDLNSN